jgi:hypothetical protein
MKSYQLLVCLLLALAVSADEFMHLRFFEYCSSLGYPVEDHVIPTDDHYNLQFYRIQGTLLATQPSTPRCRREGGWSICSTDWWTPPTPGS